jgi:uroporphyrin-III C-methyltransferase
MEEKQDINTTTESVPTKVRRNPALLLATIALIFAILAAGELGFHERSMSKQLAAMQAQAQQSQTAAAQLQNQLANNQKQLQQQQTALTDLQQQVNGKQDSWVLSEVNYLVQQANYYVRFVQDAATAIALLQAADQRFATLDDPKFLGLRQLLTKSISDLQAVPKVDVAGILLKLNNLQQQVNQLPLLLPRLMPEKSAVNANKASWRQALQTSWQTLRQLIVVRRVDKAIAPLLSLQDQTYLQQDVQLLLQQAEFAALRNQNEIYQNSLHQAKTLIQRYYASGAPITQSVVQTLTDLQAINVTPSLPDLTHLAQVMQKAKQGV